MKQNVYQPKVNRNLFIFETLQKTILVSSFLLLFFPMIYLFAGRVDKTRTLYFYPYYVCSLFSNLKFYLFNLKVETDITFNKMTLSQQNLNLKLQLQYFFLFSKG
jgi:hypothetical protein